MTDSQTTELLREGLTKRGIEWRSGLEGVTFVGDWCFVEYDNGKLAATCEPALTPEQAIAATLGSDEPIYDELLRCLENDWNIKASWDGLRKFWHIELTEEVVKLRDTTHGTLTAEQVREVIERHSAWVIGNNRCFHDGAYEEIADELNAKLGSGTCEFVIENNMNESEGMGDVWFRCTNCGTCYDYYAYDLLLKMPHCPRCGATVKGVR